MTRPGAGLPVTDDEARAAAAAAMDVPGADAVEVVVGASASGVTRYANSQIIQNTARTEVRAYVRAVVGDRVATATTNQLDRDHMLAAAARAVEAAQASPPDAEFPGLPDPSDVGRPDPCWTWDDATAVAGPAERAAAVTEMLGVASAGSAAGVYETSAHCYGVYSSAGVGCFDAYTRCVATCLVDVGEATGWGEASSYARAGVDVEAAAARALDKARRATGASDAPPGVYEVVLEPPAVATLLEYLSYAGMGAKQVIEGESFLAARAGETVAADRVTIADDARHPRSVGIGFDFEGVPKRRVAVIERGVATRPVSDLRTARKLGVEPTGHSSGSNEFGPYAAHVVLEPGDAAAEDLIAGVDRGLLVTRFHYVNVLDRPKVLLTGMTRDGTFRIERGEVAGPVHNLRFTQGVLEALGGALGVGRDASVFVPEFSSYGSTVAPALRLAALAFTSTTSH